MNETRYLKQYEKIITNFNYNGKALIFTAPFEGFFSVEFMDKNSDEIIITIDGLPI